MIEQRHVYQMRIDQSGKERGTSSLWRCFCIYLGANQGVFIRWTELPSTTLQSCFGRIYLGNLWGKNNFSSANFASGSFFSISTLIPWKRSLRKLIWIDEEKKKKNLKAQEETNKQFYSTYMSPSSRTDSGSFWSEASDFNVTILASRF